VKELRIPFKGWDLIAFLNEKDGSEMVAVRPIAEAIGLDWKSQHRKITNDSDLTCGHMTTRDSIGRPQEMLCLPVMEINLWLGGISSNRIKEDVRSKLREFKKECQLAIYNHMNGVSSPETLALLYKIIEQQQITIDALQTAVHTLTSQVDVHNKMLGVEASVAGKRLAAARHLKLVGEQK
jgi:hypothetical protein